MPELELGVQKDLDGNVHMSPLVQELKLQLDDWKASIPDFLGWSDIPSKGISAQISTRVKFTYWFARFAMIIPILNKVLCDQNYQLPFFGWSLFQEGLQAGFNMIKVAVLEDADMDLIMGNR